MDRWIYDKTGRVIEVADSDDGRRVVEKYLQKVSVELKEHFFKFYKKDFKKKLAKKTGALTTCPYSLFLIKSSFTFSFYQHILDTGEHKWLK